MRAFNDCVVSKRSDTTFEIFAPSETDFFADPLSSYRIANAPFYAQPSDADFDASVKIEPGFGATGDAGALFVYEHDWRWFKAAFELSDLGYTSVVTVVTDGFSDDSNGERIAADAAWLRVLRRDAAWSVHYSLDGANWQMVRYFPLNLNRTVNVGVAAQSPAGNGCTVRFDSLSILENRCSDMRKVFNE